MDKRVITMGELLRYQIIGDSVTCTQCTVKAGHQTTFPNVPWDEDEQLNPCPYCKGRLERNIYLVDLSAYWGIGCCSCIDFAIRREPILKTWEHLTPEQIESNVRVGTMRCKHLVRARRYFLDEVIQKLAKNEITAIPQANRRDYALKPHLKYERKT